MQKPKNEDSYLKRRRRAFSFAFSGLASALKEEPHMRIHFAAAILSVAAGFYFNISTIEWIAIVGCITLVAMAELFNTALEDLCDAVQPEEHPLIKRVKDISSAAVLLTCILAVVVGILVFGPKLF